MHNMLTLEEIIFQRMKLKPIYSTDVTRSNAV